MQSKKRDVCRDNDTHRYSRIIFFLLLNLQKFIHAFRLFKKNEETRISRDENCMVLECNGEECSRVADRFNYALLGVMVNLR